MTAVRSDEQARVRFVQKEFAGERSPYIPAAASMISFASCLSS